MIVLWIKTISSREAKHDKNFENEELEIETGENTKKAIDLFLTRNKEVFE